MPNIIIEKARSVMTDPRNFFTKLKRERGLKDAWVYFAMVSLVSLAGGIIVNLLLPTTLEFGAMVAEPVTAAQTVLASVAGYAASLLLVFVGVGIVHLWIMLFGGRAPYSKTFQLAAYASTPSSLFGWIPMVGFLAGIYSLVLYIIGAPRTHGMSMKRSLWCFLLPVGLLFLLFLVGVFLFIYFAMAMRGTPIQF